MENELQQHLSKFAVKDLVPSGYHLISANKNDKVFDVLRMLTTKKVLAVPVLDSETNKFIGLVDVLDLLLLVVQMSDMKKIVDLMNGKEVDWATYLARENNIVAKQTIADIINASARNPWVPINANKSITDLMTLFARIPVEQDGEIIGLVSQSRLIDFLSHEITKFPAMANKKFSECLPGLVTPISVSPSSLAIDAYRVLIEKGISAVAVVDDNNGKLVGCLAASDIKGSTTENVFADLYLPLPLYWDKAIPEFQRKSLTPITFLAGDSVESCLKKISAGKVHRLFLVNEEGKATSIASLGDFIAALHLSSQIKN